MCVDSFAWELCMFYLMFTFKYFISDKHIYTHTLYIKHRITHFLQIAIY
jgi:hypothetical protein